MIDNIYNQNQIIEKDKTYWNIRFRVVNPHNYIPDYVNIIISPEESITSLIDKYLTRFGLQYFKDKFKFLWCANSLENYKHVASFSRKCNNFGI